MKPSSLIRSPSHLSERGTRVLDDQSAPLITVLLPVYNTAPYLRLAIESILQQTLGDFELIAIDDGSTDASKAILDTYAKKDPRVRVISRPNTGIVGALNDGLAAARGEFIARMDGDDVALPARFIEQASYLKQHPDCVAVGTAVQIIDEGGRVVDLHAPGQTHSEIETELLKGNGGALYHPTAMFRTAAVRALKGYDPEFCKAEDVDLYLRLSRTGRMANLPTVGLQYRHHLKSTNFLHRERQAGLLKRILARERSWRNLPPIEAPLTGHSDLPLGRLHARWACTALVHGTRRTAIRHALIGVLKGPTDRECWRALTYVLTARAPRHAASTLPAPQG